MTLKEYIRKNWDGWPLHCLIAIAVMLPFISNSYPAVTFAMNVVFWPAREMWQHDRELGARIGFKHIWTLHRMIEWGAPIVAAALVWGIWL